MHIKYFIYGRLGWVLHCSEKILMSYKKSLEKNAVTVDIFYSL